RALSEAELVPGELLTLDLNFLVVNTGEHTVLIDSGMGNIVAGLQAAEIDLTSIDTVVLSHAHPDHIGGLLDENGRPRFSHARHILPRVEWDFWITNPSLGELLVSDDQREWLRSAPRSVFPAIRDRLELVEFGQEVIPGITVVEAIGHTPGHAAIELTSEGKRLLYMADAMTHAGLQFPHLEWVGGVDNWPAHSILTRRRLLDHDAGSDTLVMAAHFPFPGIGRVTKGDQPGRWHWEPIR
ncbi:MAG: MBL fold metallo-hydrolase, partial [Ktedonobacteraceae bacterium]|nr:MBL fold metallo-hydrolase [Ktedonobacteraceae bacterium]